MSDWLPCIVTPQSPVACPSVQQTHTEISVTTRSLHLHCSLKPRKYKLLQAKRSSHPSGLKTITLKHCAIEREQRQGTTLVVLCSYTHVLPLAEVFMPKSDLESDDVRTLRIPESPELLRVGLWWELSWGQDFPTEKLIANWHTCSPGLTLASQGTSSYPPLRSPKGEST